MMHFIYDLSTHLGLILQRAYHNYARVHQRMEFAVWGLVPGCLMLRQCGVTRSRCRACIAWQHLSWDFRLRPEYKNVNFEYKKCLNCCRF